MADPSEQDTEIIAFLSGAGPDACGRSFDNVLALDNRDLEQNHDYIQWLFPLRTPSMAVPGSPILTHTDIRKIISNTDIQARLFRARERMLRFYNETDHWLVYHDHNHLRITRILLSTSLLTGKIEAIRVHYAILDRINLAAAPVSPASRKYWADAVSGGHNDK